MKIPANIYSLLLVAGYLKTPQKELQADGSYLCEVSVPNREIAAVYKNEILTHLLQIGAVTRTTADKIAESLYANDHKKLQAAIAEYMDKTVSFYDAGTEGFYHGLILGLVALTDAQYRIEKSDDIDLKDYFIEADQSYVIEKNGAYVMLLRLCYGNASIFSPALDKYMLVAQIHEEIPLENLSGYDYDGFERELEQLLQLIEDKKWEKYEMPDDLHRFFTMIL